MMYSLRSMKNAISSFFPTDWCGGGVKRLVYTYIQLTELSKMMEKVSLGM